MIRKSIRYMLAAPADVDVRAVGYADNAFVFVVDVMPRDWVGEPSEVAGTATTVGSARSLHTLGYCSSLRVFAYLCYQHNTWRTHLARL